MSSDGSGASMKEKVVLYGEENKKYLFTYLLLETKNNI